jgi:hypothetical protein
VDLFKKFKRLFTKTELLVSNLGTALSLRQLSSRPLGNYYHRLVDGINESFDHKIQKRRMKETVEKRVDIMSYDTKYTLKGRSIC